MEKKKAKKIIEYLDDKDCPVKKDELDKDMRKNGMESELLKQLVAYVKKLEGGK